MSRNDLQEFQKLLNTDIDFQDKLKTMAENYTGDPGDKAVFDNLLVPLAKEYGLSATYEEFEEYMGAFMGGGEGELSEDELAMVAGGKGLCFIIGGSDGFDADGNVDINGLEGHVCYYVGIGIILPNIT